MSFRQFKGCSVAETIMKERENISESLKGPEKQTECLLQKKGGGVCSCTC